MTRRAPGFSLIEMAFVLIIVTLLLGGLLVPFATQVEQKRISETNKAMEEIKEALLGFAVVNGRLPCPAISASVGLEQAAPCVAAGWLPWATLSTAKSDAWGRLYRYKVVPDFAQTAPLFSLSTDATLNVQTRDAVGAIQTLASGTVAAVISHGKNGYGGTDPNANAVAGATSADEITNATAENNFMSRTIIGPSNPCGAAGQPLCEFDDLVTWLSPNVLFNRMVAAGRLP